jgi:superfamily II DNA or RNA helicase
MYRQIRKKIASSLSTIELAEDFAYSKWLKEPKLNNPKIDSPHSSLLDTTKLNNRIEIPGSEAFKILIRESDVLPEFKKVLSRKTRTSAIFFGFGLADVKKFKASDYDAIFLKRKAREISFKGKSPQIKNIKWKAASPQINSLFKQLIPDILKLDLLKAELFSIENYLGSDSAFKFEAINTVPKIYKVKIPGIDKIKLGKIYFLKNIKPEGARILKESFYPVKHPEIFEQNLDLLGVIWSEESVALNKGPEEPETIEVHDELNDFIDNIINKISAVEDISIDDSVNIIDNLEDENITVKGKIDKELSEPEPEVQPEDIVKTDSVKQEVDEPAAEVQSYENIFDSVYSYQETGAEFLLDKKFALLLDDLGLGKTVQAVSALKNLFASKKIKTALIICSKHQIGSTDTFDGNIDGWLGHLKTWAPELNFTIISGTPHERNLKWKESTRLHIASYDSFFFDLEENIIEKKKLKSFECLIFDEAQHLFNKVLNSDKFNKSVKPSYIWALSAYPSDKINNEINSVFTQKFSISNSLKRSKPEVSKELPAIIWQENWLELDEQQEIEYSASLQIAKEKVNWLIESGNPLRFQANIFTILHQLKQVCNFSEKSDVSPKTGLLLEQVDAIVKNKQKVIIFSQYDKLGTKKIEALFNKYSIKHVSCAPGMSTKEMETAVKNFTSSGSIAAMIAGVKPARIKIQSGEIPYIIHFDQWWNPASLWQTEELIFSFSARKNLNGVINVYNYFSKGTIEEKINKLLFRKGFLNKNVMDLFNAETIGEMIANEEWLEVFDMHDEKFIKGTEEKLKESEKRLLSLSPADFLEALKIFFTKLGIKNLDVVKSGDGKTIDIKGISKKLNVEVKTVARVILSDIVNDKELKAHLSDLKELTQNGKAFIISKGSFENESPVKYNSAITLIGKKLLANYFNQFRVF